MTMPQSCRDIGPRGKAWLTRRAKYGPRGHNSSYSRGATSGASYDGMLALIIRLHNDGTLSEGQVARATGLDRVSIRVLADEARQPQNVRDADCRPCDTEGPAA